MLIHDWDPRILMLESPTKSQCPGTPSDEIAPAEQRNTTDRTVNTSPVNSPHNVNRTRTPTLSTLCVTTVHCNITRPTHINNPSHLYDTLNPILLHQHSTLASLQHILNPIQHLNTIPTHKLQLLHQLLGSHPSARPHLPPPSLKAAAHAGHPPSPTSTQMTLPTPPHRPPSPSPWAPKTE